MLSSRWRRAAPKAAALQLAGRKSMKDGAVLDLAHILVCESEAALRAGQEQRRETASALMVEKDQWREEVYYWYCGTRGRVFAWVARTAVLPVGVCVWLSFKMACASLLGYF